MRWEYKTVYVSDVDVNDRRVDASLAPMGEHGWELVGVASRDKHGYTHEVILFFKRPATGA
jgi:hypothetical protein